ncbi:RNA polymerase sigma factor [Paenibacillus sp. y28]|uniref:RNA polymerase sigma factor n=1 Tax=Paenibacillus sp. y28 TaxID=3129110 RepID=UPI0030167827
MHPPVIGAEQFATMYHKYLIPLQHYIYRYTRNDQDAEDIAQEAFMRMYMRAINPETAKAWLYRTAYHLFVDNWRKNKKWSGVPIEAIPEPLGLEQHTPERMLLAGEMRDEIGTAIQRLKPREQAVLHMIQREGVSYQVIAKRLGCSENTVKSVVFRARRRMRNWVDLTEAR